MGGIQPGAADPQARLGDLDLDGIDVQVIFSSFGLGLTALQDIPASVQELRRATQEPGFIGIALPPNVNVKNLDPDL